KIQPSEVAAARAKANLNGEEFDSWSAGQLWDFAGTLREISKPTIIVANKMDLPGAMKNYKKLRDAHPDLIVVPASAEAELALRRAEQNNLIRYNPGDESFEILDEKSLNQAQRNALQLIQRMVLKEFMRTGVQFALNVTVFKLLKMNVVYPVQDVDKLSDKHNNVLPDAHLLPAGATVLDLAQLIHSDLAKGLLYAIDARTKLRLPNDYVLKDRDILSLVSARRRA
ncbi:MAG: TGS domain-containing protein, partial [Conexivisphaerales archaeon]